MIDACVRTHILYACKYCNKMITFNLFCKSSVNADSAQYIAVCSNATDEINATQKNQVIKQCY